MRLPRKAKKESEETPSPEDTQEMFTSGQVPPGDPEETREYEAVAVEEPETEQLIEDEDAVEAIEEESWEGDEYEEWEDDLEEPESGDPDFEDDDLSEGDPEEEKQEDEAETGDPEKPGRGEDFKVWFKEFSLRVQTIWKGLLKRAGEIKLPRHEIDGQKVLAGAGIVAIALLVGAGGYFIGKGSGDDLDTARLEGEFAGKRAGAIAGSTKGYATGFKKGRDIAFRKSYSASYRRNYRRAYENAGMDPPKAEDIEVPKP